LAATFVSTQASANLVLNTVPGLGMATTATNDFAGKPGHLYLGLLSATANGFVDFYFIGNEAGYTNTLVMGGTSHSTAGLPDTFSSIGGGTLVGSVGVTAGNLVDFGFCTSGGDNIWYLPQGRCAMNNLVSALGQYFYGGVTGYRSIGFHALNAGGNWANTAQGAYSSWGLFWDDSGAANDDNHDDYIAVARFRAVQVPEPAALLLLGLGVLGVALTQRIRSRAVA
jgi:hypothetical protein